MENFHTMVLVILPVHIESHTCLFSLADLDLFWFLYSVLFFAGGILYPCNQSNALHEHIRNCVKCLRLWATHSKLVIQLVCEQGVGQLSKISFTQRADTVDVLQVHILVQIWTPVALKLSSGWTHIDSL